MKRLLLLILLVLAAGCQQSTEPEDITISDVVVSIKVADQGGRGIEGVEVRFAVGVANDTLVPFGRGRTGDDGIVSQTFSVPATGTIFTIEVEPPGEAKRRYDSVAIPCSDFQFEVEIPREVTIACGEQLPDEDLALSICSETKAVDTICTALLDPLCPRPMTVSAGPVPIPIPGASLLMRLNGTPQPGSSVTLNTGDRCEVCLVYRAQSNGSAGTQRVAVTGAPSGQPSYRLLNVDFSVESKCDSCSCPPAMTIDYPTATSADTICVGEEQDISINLGRVVNSNEACDLLFSLERGPVTPGLRIRSFNAGENDLEPGSSLSPLRLSITPTAPGVINESLVYTVRTRAGDGSLVECGRLTVNVHLVATAPGCPLLLSGSLIDVSGPGRTVPISQNVCDPGTGSFKTLCITNPSTRCGFTLRDLTLSGLDESQFELEGRSFPIEIAPGGSECLEIRFKPTRAYYVASGNPPRSSFTAQLTISTICGDSVLPVTGIIPAPRIPPMRLFPTSCSVNPNTGIRTQADGAIVTDQQAAGGFLITVESVTIGPGSKSAVLDITTQFRLLRTGLTDATPLCDLRFDPAARNACGSLGAAGRQTVQEGEVYIFSYEYQGCQFCALLWVESIDDVSVTRSCPQVQFRICSPLVY